MDTIALTKHHGLGNDFLITFDAVANPVELAQRLCDRRRGIGADGLIIGVDHDDPSIGAQMILHNADGSRAEISGNGVRCFAQALAARLSPATTDGAPVETQVEMQIATDAGVKAIEIIPTNDDNTLLVSVDMGEVEELTEPDNWAATGCHPDRPVRHLSLGNPHSVVGVEDVDGVDLDDLGARVPNVNLEIVAPTERRDKVRMRVHERGVGVTEACGSGAVASAYAAAGWGLVTPDDGKVTVEMDGGCAIVALNQPTAGRVTLTGTTTVVGTIVVPAADHHL